LREHELVPTGDSELICQICDERFKKKQLLSAYYNSLIGSRAVSIPERFKKKQLLSAYYNSLIGSRAVSIAHIGC